MMRHETTPRGGGDRPYLNLSSSSVYEYDVYHFPQTNLHAIIILQRGSISLQKLCAVRLQWSPRLQAATGFLGILITSGSLMWNIFRTFSCSSKNLLLARQGWQLVMMMTAPCRWQYSGGISSQAARLTPMQGWIFCQEGIISWKPFLKPRDQNSGKKYY